MAIERSLNGLPPFIPKALLARFPICPIWFLRPLPNSLAPLAIPLASEPIALFAPSKPPPLCAKFAAALPRAWRPPIIAFPIPTPAMPPKTPAAAALPALFAKSPRPIEGLPPSKKFAILSVESTKRFIKRLSKTSVKHPGIIPKLPTFPASKTLLER